MSYALPTPSDLRARYPAFAAKSGDPLAYTIPDETIQYWLDYVVGENVDQSWADPAGARAQIAAAAHRMAENGVLGTASADDGDLAGVTDFRSASFQVRFSDDYVKQQIAGGWESTQYGRDYLDLLRANRGGMGVTSPGHVPCYGYDGWSPIGWCR
jgi:hypothetical protein